MTTKSTDKDTKETAAENVGVANPAPPSTGNAEFLKQAAFDLYTSNHIATDDVAVRLEKLEAYLNKVDGVEAEE